MAGFVASGARADLISISVENSFSGSNGLSGTLTVQPGMEYLVTGTLTNIGSTPVVMNTQTNFGTFNINVTGDPNQQYFGQFGPDTSVFNPPDTLAPEPDAPVDVDLFDLTVSAATPVGAYNDWTYSVLDASGDLVGAGSINVIVQAPVPTVPEPASLALIGIGLAFAAAYQQRRLKVR